MVGTLPENWLILLVLAAAGLMVVLLVGVIRFRRSYYIPKPRHGVSTPRDFGLPAMDVEYRAVQNQPATHAWYAPRGLDKKYPVILFMHGWNADASVWLPLAAQLHQSGFSLLLPDARGHGRNRRETHCTVADVTDDIMAGIAWLKARGETDADRIVLIGHSLGAVAALAATSRSKQVWRTISISAYAHATDPLLGTARRSPFRRVVAWLNMRAAELRDGFRYAQYNAVDLVKEIRCPILLVHGDRDRVVPIADAHRIHAQANPDTAHLLIVPKAGHGTILRSEMLRAGVEEFLLCARKQCVEG